MGLRARRATRWVTALVVVPAALAACTATTEEPASPPSTPSAALRVQAVTGVGGLDQQARTQLESEVGDVLSRYIVEAYLGDFPRREFVGAFESFTSGAARAAARDIEQLTAAPVQDATAVRAERLAADLSVIADGRDVIGAAAALDLAFEATLPDGQTRPLSLEGRFLLEHLDGEWSVFGYDVASDDGAAVSGGEAP